VCGGHWQLKVGGEQQPNGSTAQTKSGSTTQAPEQVMALYMRQDASNLDTYGRDK
jgi:hypothetical protein